MEKMVNNGNATLPLTTLDRIKQNKYLNMCYKCLLWVPPVLIFLFFMYGFIEYNLVHCYLVLYQNGFYLIAFLQFIGFNTYFTLSIVSFFKAVFTDGGSVPPGFTYQKKPNSPLNEEYVFPINENDHVSNRKERSPSPQPHQQQLQQQPNATTDENGTLVTEESVTDPQDKEGVTLCKRCEIERPVRAHHCQACGTCKLKMDHHCPVLNNCVAFYNYKYFVLTLVHASLMCIWGLMSVLTRLYLIPFEDYYNVIALQYLLGVALGLGLTAVLVPFAGMHFYFIFRNTTTLEVTLRKYYMRQANYSEINIYDVGYKKNFQQVFGDNWVYWFLPVHTSIGDGCYFPTIHVDHNYQNTIDRSDVIFNV